MKKLLVRSEFTIQDLILSNFLSDYERSSESRNEVIVAAWLSGGYKMKKIAEYFGLHYSSVSKIIKAHEDSQFKTSYIDHVDDNQDAIPDAAARSVEADKAEVRRS